MRPGAMAATPHHVGYSVMVLALLLGVLSHQGMAAPAAAGADTPYVDRMSKRPWIQYPGGSFKPTNNRTLATSAISGGLFKLKPWGLRELHWHDATEWAFVINGTCRATMIDDGSLKAPADTWDFSEGDIWYFPANTGHAILGLPPYGCTFLTGYDDPSFDERTSFGASSWVASVPADALAQGLGISAAAAAQLKKTAPAAGTFLPLAKPVAGQSATPPVKAQTPPLSHRYPLSQNQPAFTGSDGSYVIKADQTMFPVSKKMGGALLYLPPRSMRALHWHLDMDEWQFVINGTVEAGVFVRPGVFSVVRLQAGDVGVAPRGTGHYLRNPTDQPVLMVGIFNSGTFTDIEIPNFFGTVPLGWLQASLNTTSAVVDAVSYAPSWFLPAKSGYPGFN